MTVISYMGTKAALIDPINEAIGKSREGALLDLFAGMSAVGRSHENGRNVWLNDAQVFSKVVSEYQFRDVLNIDKSVYQIDTLFRSAFEQNQELLFERFTWFLNRERNAMAKKSGAKLSELDTILRHSYEQGALAKSRSAGGYDLFARTHSGTFFSLTQAIEIDSIRFSVNKITESRPELFNWALCALGRAMIKCSNSTGHFAQYLTYKPKIDRRYLLQRSKSIWTEWKKALSEITQVGTADWRARNKVFNQDANSLLLRMRRWKNKPSVVYADPPYTDDQYSRFYHLLETMVLYDFPKTAGKGQYRDSRFRSNFSLRSLVDKEFDELIKNAARTDADLVLSYPTNGLLENSCEKIPDLMSKYFKVTHNPVTIDHQHSTLGASKGLEKHFVSEQIFLARH